MEYFCCYHSYARKLAKLSDQEVGRLFRALLDYSARGEAPELTGRESVAFDFIADDIDRSRAVYEERCRTNAANGNLGGRPPKKRPGKPDGFPETQSKDKSKTKGEGKGEGKD